MTALRQIYPPAAGGGTPDLPALYAYPGAAQDPGRPWVRANMISSADGAAEVDGLSGGLSGAPDRTVFGLLRALADVILVGAGTVRAERYQPARVGPRWAGLRAGRPAAPPIAVLTGRLDLDLDGPLLAGPAADGARTMVITARSAPQARRDEVARQADLIIAGEDRVDPAAAVAELARRGLRRDPGRGRPAPAGPAGRVPACSTSCASPSARCWPAGRPAGSSRARRGPAPPPRWSWPTC